MLAKPNGGGSDVSHFAARDWTVAKLMSDVAIKRILEMKIHKKAVVYTW